MGYEMVWDSSLDLPISKGESHAPGKELEVGPASTVLLKVIAG